MTALKKKSLADKTPTDATVSEAVPGRSTRNIVEALYSPETADLEWEPEQPESAPYRRPVDL